MLDHSKLENAESNPAIASQKSLIKLRYGARELTNFPNPLARKQISGTHKSRWRGRGMDFEEVRIYRPGDDIRSIDWRVTARTQVTHTKVFSEERERPILVITDLRGAMFFGSQQLKSVVASKIAATLVWAGLAANDRVGGLIFGQQRHEDVRAKRSHHAVLQYIHSLHSFSKELMNSREENFTLKDILQESKQLVLPGSTLFIISDFNDLDDDCSRHLFDMARLARVNFCHVYDILEVELPPPSIYAVSDGKNKTLLDSRNSSLRQNYANLFRTRCDQIKALTEKLGGDLLTFNTSENIMSILGRTYGKRRRRA